MDVTAEKLTAWEQAYRNLYPDATDAVDAEEELVEAINQSNLGVGARSAAKVIATCQTQQQRTRVIASMMAVGIRAGIALAQSELLKTTLKG